MIHSGVGTSNLLVSQVSCIECFQKGNSFWHLYTQHIFHLCHSLNDNAAQNVRFFHLKFIAPPHSILQCCSPIVTLMLYIAVHNICIWNKHFYFQCTLMIEGISSRQSMSKLENTIPALCHLSLFRWLETGPGPGTITLTKQSLFCSALFNLPWAALVKTNRNLLSKTSIIKFFCLKPSTEQK